LPLLALTFPAAAGNVEDASLPLAAAEVVVVAAAFFATPPPARNP